MSVPLDVKLLDIERVAEERIRVKCSGDDGRMGGDRDGVDGIVEQWARERPDLDTTAMAVFGRVLRLARLAGDETSRVYDGFGLSRPEFDVLATLRRAGEPYALSPGALAASMMMSSGGTTARLDKLESAGLVQRHPDPADRRALLVRLTDDGFRVVDTAVTAGLDRQQQLLAHLSDSEQRRLSALLRRVLAPLEPPG
jgi:DNA-binding MarR family transcriptional regulator